MSDETRIEGDHWQGARSEGPGSVIGPYTLLRLLGEGGFGDVYEAEQSEPVKRTVALKIVKLGMDTREVIARFELERQALALMDHSHIARVLDAGATASGRPYFVMERVEGEPITAYCDNRALPIEQRLALFEQVCEAVQHAHTKGVIHRDLKPGNVLVHAQDGHDIAKVIDFGIAKAISGELTDHTHATRMDQVIGTPLYMSPEQARGNADIDTRSDIYALGVILYELLTGSTPVERSALSSISLADSQRLICETEPPTPSARLSKAAATATGSAGFHANAARVLARKVRGELDWIVMKAIEKDRSRRYDTASAFAADVRRYLDGEPVLAVPPGRAYRFGKFVRRNKAGVTAGLLVALSLLAGLVAFAWQAQVAKRNEALAERRAEDLRHVAQFQSDMFGKLEPIQVGKALHDDVIRRYRQALLKAGVPADETQSQVTAFTAQWQHVNGADTATDLIDRTILTPAVAEIEHRFARQPLVAASLRQALADSYLAFGLFDKAAPLQASALQERLRLLGSADPDTQHSMVAMGKLLEQQGKFDDAEKWLRRGLQARQKTYGANHPLTLEAMADLGSVLDDQGKQAQAEPLLRQALERRRKVLDRDDPDIADAESRLGGLLLDEGKADAALPLLQQALEDYRRILGNDDALTVNSINDVGVAWMSKGRPDKAEPYFRQAWERHRALQGEEHPDTVQAQANLGGILMVLGRASDAEPILRSAIDKSRRLFGIDNGTTLLAMATLGQALIEQGRFAEAERLLAPAQVDASKVLAETSPPQYGLFMLALGRARAGQGKFVGAESALLAAHRAFDMAAGPRHGHFPTLCVQALVALYQDWDKAEPGKEHAKQVARWQAWLEEGGTKKAVGK